MNRSPEEKEAVSSKNLRDTPLGYRLGHSLKYRCVYCRTPLSPLWMLAFHREMFSTGPLSTAGPRFGLGGSLGAPSNSTRSVIL